MPFDLVEPAGLFALAALVPVLLLYRRSAVPQRPLRRRLGLAFRLAGVLALVLALAGLRLVRSNDRLTVIFCLDWSDSVDPAAKREALAAIEQALRARAGRPASPAAAAGAPPDRAGIVVFGLDAQLEAPPDAAPEVREPAAAIERGATDIGRAIRLAAASFPDDARKRIVVVSDGAENRGDALREAEMVAAAGVEIDAIALDTAPAGQEVLVDSVRAPRRVRRGEMLDLDIVLRARRAGKATVRVIRRDARGETLLPAREVDLRPGLNRLSPPYRDRLEDEDGYLYRVVVESLDDANPANNRGEALVDVGGETRVLYAEGVAGEDRYLATALRKAGMRVDTVGPSDVPAGLEDLARYDALILSDVPATALSEPQMAAIRDYVRFLGGGLLMAGGAESFGAGGYYKTAVEEALPVTMEIRHQKHLPSCAIVFCIDKSGSMGERSATGVEKMDLAKEGAILTSELLTPEDWVGCCAFDDAAKWVLPLRHADDQAAIAAQIRTLRAGGGTDMYPSVAAAHRALRGVKAQIKHMIVLSDGMTNAADFPTLVPQIVADGITISTISVGADADLKFMAWLAHAGAGKHFAARSVAQVPRIFTKDALMVMRPLIVQSETGISLEVRGASPILKALPVRAPPVYGFVQTTPKERADVLLTTPKDEPLLVTWQCGLGRSVAWTPDVKSAWARDWVRWAGYDPFFAQVTKWLARKRNPEGLRTEVSIEDGRGRVVVEAVDEAGEYRNGLDLRGTLAGGAAGGREIPLRQTGPGRYEAEFDAARPGAYFATVVERGQGAEGAPAKLATAGAVASYPPEYKDLEPNPGLLRRLAEIGGGKFVRAGEPLDAFRRTGEPVRTFSPLWFHLLAVAAAALVCEVAARRLVTPELVRRAVASARAARAPHEAASAVLERLRTKKAALRGATAEVVPPPPPAPVEETPPATIVASREREPEREEAAVPGSTPARAGEPERAPDGRPPATPAPGRATETTSRLLEAKRRARGER
jgi:uncharacterized membrane protein